MIDLLVHLAIFGVGILVGAVSLVTWASNQLDFALERLESANKTLKQAKALNAQAMRDFQRVEKKHLDLLALAKQVQNDIDRLRKLNV